MQKKKFKSLSLLVLSLIGVFSFLTNDTTFAASVAIQPPIFTTLSDHTLIVGSGLGMLVIANSPSGLPVTISLVSAPQGASFNPANGNFNWAPTAQDIGSNTISFSATDGTNTVTKSIIITVLSAPATVQPPVVQPPVIQPPVITNPPVSKPLVVQPPTIKPSMTKQTKSHGGKNSSNKISSIPKTKTKIKRTMFE